MQEVIDRLASPSEIAMAAVLEDDLHSLVEECEEYLISGGAVPTEQIRSFETRTVTVLDEISALDFLRNQVSA